MIDIKAILSSHKIYYVESGPNTGKGYIGINCPLCKKDSDPDPSQHMQIQLAKGYWHCWRGKGHSGRDIYALLELLGIHNADRDFLSTTFDQPQVYKPIEHVKIYKLPDTFIPINNGILDIPYRHYLKTRGFNNPDIVIKQYNLRRSNIHDKWQDRIIIPVENDIEISWTARSIDPNNTLRYRSPGVQDAGNIKDHIFNYQELKNSSGNGIIVTEGPLDAISGDFYSKEFGYRFTCLFGMAAVDKQIKLIKTIAPNFKQLYLALDAGTESSMFYLAQQLEKFSPIIIQIPKKDIGEMTQQDLIEFIKGLEQYQ
jgi:hypothetical protein